MYLGQPLLHQKGGRTSSTGCSEGLFGLAFQSVMADCVGQRLVAKLYRNKHRSILLLSTVFDTRNI